MSMKQQAEINRLRQELEQLKEELEVIHSRLDMLEHKKGPGRPKKVVNG